MSSSSNHKTQSDYYAEMGEKITKVAASAIRQAAKTSQAAKNVPKKTTKPPKTTKTGKK